MRDLVEQANPEMSAQTRVLLVEDNPAEASLIRLQLANARRDCYRLQIVERISDALRHLENDPPYHVILLDFNLPDSDGLTGLSRILKAARGIPVIMLTNFREEETALEAVRSGAQDYLFKGDLDTALLERSIRYGIERQTAREALRRSEERYFLALDAVRDGIWDWDMTADKSYFSDRLYEILGYTEGETFADMKYWLDHIHPKDKDGFDKALDAHMVGAIPGFEMEHRMRTRAGDYLWVLSRGRVIRDDQGSPVRMVGSLTDISNRKAAEEQLRHLALNDTLTGLPNRTLFLERVHEAMETARRRDWNFAIVFIDLDRFKSVNDSLGHGAGNKLLMAIADRLAEDCRPGDTLARLGGDEFALLLCDYPDMDMVKATVERIGSKLEAKFVIDGAELYSGASMGVATYSDSYRLSEEILRDADIAMYRAKHSIASYEIFDAGMRELATRRHKLETELRSAIDGNQFTVFYQPIISTVTGRVTEFEALVRWNHPREGMVYPKLFIGTAEDTGLVIPLGRQVIEQALADFSRFRNTCPGADGISLSVNISGKIFNTGSLAESLGAILDRHGLAPGILNLEITEHAMMDHQYRALVELKKIRDLGVGLHIDDFGTGFSSLSHLQKFSYDTLKIDGSFIRKMIDCRDNEAIVRSIIAMGKLLGMDIVAEGVETSEQLDWLMEMGCPKVQGFLFSKAVPDSRLEAVLRDCSLETATGQLSARQRALSDPVR